MPPVPEPEHPPAHAMARLRDVPFRPQVSVALEERAPGIVDTRDHGAHLVRVFASPLVASCAHTTCRYAAGDIDILPLGMEERWEELTPSRALTIRLPDAVLHDAAEQAGLGPRMTGLQARFQLRDQQIEHLAWALNADAAAGHPHGALYGELLSTALALHLLGGYRAPARPGGGLARHQLRKVTDYIEAHLGQDLRLARLAALVGMSPSHFGLQFRKSAGTTVHDYVIQRRVERARLLLQRDELPLSQIALEVGFAHQSHLSRWMRRRTGATPGELRAARRVQ